jgi:hypothetical protein
MYSFQQLITNDEIYDFLDSYIEEFCPIAIGNVNDDEVYNELTGIFENITIQIQELKNKNEIVHSLIEETHWIHDYNPKVKNEKLFIKYINEIESRIVSLDEDQMIFEQIKEDKEMQDITMDMGDMNINNGDDQIIMDFNNFKF